MTCLTACGVTFMLYLGVPDLSGKTLCRLSIIEHLSGVVFYRPVPPKSAMRRYPFKHIYNGEFQGRQGPDITK